MRHAIWKKDDFFEPHGLPRLDMKAEVIDFDEDDLPLVTNFSFATPDAVVGTVIDLKVEDGELTGEVVYRCDSRGNPYLPGDPLQPTLDPAKDRLEPARYRLGGYFSRVEKVDNQIVACQLRAVSIMPLEDTPGWVKES